MLFYFTSFGFFLFLLIQCFLHQNNVAHYFNIIHLICHLIKLTWAFRMGAFSIYFYPI